MAAALALGAVGVRAAGADLEAARAEANLEKRSKLALDNAQAALKAARAAYDKGEDAAVAAALAEMRQSVDLAHDSLQQTGKNPRGHPKYFKQAEIATRDLLRRMETFQQEMSYQDRPLVDGVKARVQQVHDELLIGLMEGNKK
jgi:phosphoglycerate-specific signal transduction histidine kinase